MKYSLLILIGLCSSISFANTGLEKKLESLNIPSDRVNPLVVQEKLYVVNKRYSSLKNRHELSLAGGKNLIGDAHLDNTLASLAYRYHINSKWSVGLRYSEYYNELSGSGKKLFDNRNLLPDSDFALNSYEAFVNFNTIYGKLRVSPSMIVYFDQYISLGYGNINLASGETQNLIADIGFSFWVGKHFSARLGMKNEFYEQQKINGNRNVHNAQGYLEFGYLFGKGTI